MIYVLVGLGFLVVFLLGLVGNLLLALADQRRLVDDLYLAYLNKPSEPPLVLVGKGKR
jgi:hypothetical protein